MGPEEIKQKASGTLADHLDLEWRYVRPGTASGHFLVKPFHLAPNGYLHAASIIALADTCRGFGCMASLPEGAKSFATIELKSNFLSTAKDGCVSCVANLAHGGRTTQVWDATVNSEQDKTVALFRCTQFLLYATQQADGKGLSK